MVEIRRLGWNGWMLEDDVRTLFATGEKRDAAKQTWLQHLHLLSAGALTLLAGMGAGGGTEGMARCFLHATWAALGLSILLGGAALYGETARHDSLSKKMAAHIQKAVKRKDASGLGGRPITVRKPLWLRAAEAGFLTSLSAATICLVAFAIVRT